MKRLCTVCSVFALGFAAAIASPAAAQSRVPSTLERSRDSLVFFSEAGREAAHSYSAAGHGLATFVGGAVLAVSLPFAAESRGAGTYVVVGASSALLIGTVLHAFRGTAVPPQSEIDRLSIQDPALRDAFTTGYREEVERKRRRALWWGPGGAALAGGALIALVLVTLRATDF